MRNLGLTILCLASLAMPRISLALGLGDIDVVSFLNQPLKAEIKIVSARPGEIESLLVGLASTDAFNRAGLSRPGYLLDLRFTIRENQAGDQATIIVTTQEPIREPFLNFLVGADWSNGRVLREYTVLLDPPFFSDSTAPNASSNASTASGGVSANNANVDLQAADEALLAGGIWELTASSDATAEPNFAESNTAQSSSTSSEIVVEKGDTLWSIASLFKDSEYTMNQVMLAMQRTNPNAFHNKNINRLKVGAVFRPPTIDEINQLSRQQAYVEALEQNGLWDDYVARVTGTSVSMASNDGGSNEATPRDQNTAGNLSLLTPGEGNSDSIGQGESTDVDGLREKLAFAEEQLDAARVESEDMRSRIIDLEAQLEKFGELQKIIQIEEDSLAQIQNNQVQKESVPVDIPTDAVESTTVESQTDVLESSLAEELQLADDALLNETLSGKTTIEGDNQPEDLAKQPAVTPADTPSVESNEMSLIDKILSIDVMSFIPSVSDIGIPKDPKILGGVGGILILLIGLVLYKRRKKNYSESIADVSSFDNYSIDDHVAENLDEPELSEDITVNFLEEPVHDVAPEINPTNQFSGRVEAAVADEEEADEQDDVLNEIDVYLAYGLYENAEELLREHLNKNPNRADYRAKLLDTYFATKNAQGFVAEAEILKSMGSASTKYWDKVQVMGYELAPDNALFSAGRDSNISASDLAITKPQVADFDLGANEDEGNFSTTFNLGEESSELTELLEETQAVPELEDLTNFGDTDEPPTEELDELEFTRNDTDDAENPDMGGNALEDDFLDFNMDELLEAQETEASSESVSPDDAEGLDAGDQVLEDGSLDFNMGDPLEAPEIEATDGLDMGSDANDENGFEFDLNDTVHETDADLDLDLGLDEGVASSDEALADEELQGLDESPLTSMGIELDSDQTEVISPDEVDINDIGDLMLPDDVDEVSTKLDLARAFIDMGDAEGARSSLEEVLTEGNDEQKAEAAQLLDGI